MRVPGLNRVKAKGRTYIYHRASGRRIEAAPGTPAFLEEVAAAEASVAVKPKAVPGTLGLLRDAYKESPFWRDLRPATRLSYQRAIDVVDPLATVALVDFTPGYVAALRDRVVATRGRWMANYVLTVLAILFDFARERDWMEENTARKVRRIAKAPDAPRANRPWTPAECRVVLDAAQPYLRLAIALGMCAGLRKRDVLTATKASLKGQTVEVRTSKRNRLVRVPLHPQLKAALAAAPAHDAVTICANSHGEPWTESGFNSTFIKFIAKLETAGRVGEGLTFHGLRHTLGTRLKEAGADDRTRADILGQASIAMAHHYAEDADTTTRDRALINAANLFGTKKRTASAKRAAKPRK
ncbi:MAG: tyrosine-type recombinase/integrase [Hyphomicrobiales bacterium]|nr:tyrosine-type recombinase/integrase [Hyphomicrobiales bacterium]